MTKRVHVYLDNSKSFGNLLDMVYSIIDERKCNYTTITPSTQSGNDQIYIEIVM